MNLPADDFILLSLVNMKLRDLYSSFGEFCKEEGVDPEEVMLRLLNAGYAYDEPSNAFKAV